MVQGVIICFVYVALLTVINKVVGVKYTDLLLSESNLKKGLVLPVAFCAALLTIFAYMRGFAPEVFSYSPRVSSIVLWLVPLVICAGIVLRFLHPQWSKFTKKGMLYLVIGAFVVGLSEELLVRGIFVNLLQTNGYSVLAVGLVTSAVFGLMHGVNFFTGQDAKTTVGQMITTTLIGINFYVVLIITGSLWVPIVLHALHDLSLFAQGGEINKNDSHVNKPELGVTLALFALAPISIIILWFM